MNSTDMKKWLAAFVLLGAGAMISIHLTSRAQAGVAGTGPIRAPDALKQPQPMQTKPLTSGPSGNPTLGGIDRILVNPLPATVGNQVKFTIQGWGKCTSVQISFGDSPQFYVLSDVDFSKPFEQMYVYRTATNPGQPYVMSVAGRPTQPSPCTTQATAQVDVRPVPIGAKMPSSSVAKSQQSIGGNIGGLPGALKESSVEARGAQKEGAIPKPPPPAKLPPEITSVWTAGIRPGEIVNIVGKHFGTTSGQARMIRGLSGDSDILLDITQWKDDFVQGRVPANYPPRDTSAQTLQVLTPDRLGSNVWNVHSGVVIEETSREVPANVVRVEYCAQSSSSDSCYTTPSFSGYHSSSTKSADGTDTFSIRLANGWRLHSYRFEERKGVDGGLRGFVPGATSGEFSVKWFHDWAGSATYYVTLVIVGPKDLEPY